MAHQLDAQSEAPESNAGDDFHLLWAARLALLMLHPNNSIRALGIEGPAPGEAVQTDPTGSQLLGIDVTEYHNGASFADCSTAIHSQLKYSTRRSSAAWTTARIVAAKGGKKSGSIVHRLAQIFRAYAQAFSREEVVKKLRLRLVSNRACDSQLSATLAAAQHALSPSKEEHSVAELLRQIATTYHPDLENLHVASGLSSEAFCDFLRVLDLSGCGEQSRFTLEIALSKEIARLGFTDITSEYTRLKQLIHTRMMPENRTAPPLTQEDVAAALRVPDKAYIFPCPPQFEPLHAPVKREQLGDIRNAIIGAGEHPVCLHGAAGIGKTTLSRCIASVMPPGSVVVVFDCYGAGSYLVPSEIRHSHSRAIAQICNELATSVGTSLLLGRDRPPEDLLRAYESRLELAAQIVQASSNAALVIIIIDAADNSVAAAGQRDDKSFVPDILRCRIPVGCRLVVTARSHRRHDLGLPSDTVTVPLQPFNERESREHLLFRFPEASNEVISEFHELSHGIPRVQGYAIGVASGDLQRAMASLRPGGKTVEGIIDRQLADAGLKAGAPELVEKGCRALLALPRPIPMAYVAQLMGVSPEAARDFVSDLRPGLLVDDDRVTFRDEDFEAHLRQRFEPDKALLRDLAEVLRARCTDDVYAAENVADVFARASMHEQIIELVRADRQPAIIKDPIVRQEVFARRARLAVAAALRLQKPGEIINLLFVVAEASKVDKAVEDLLLQNADLACRYGDPTSVQRLYLNEDNPRLEWYGPTHLLCAANYARFDGTLRRAEGHLKQARAWIRHWSSLCDAEREEWQLRAEDIAHETEAALRLKGLHHASDSLSRWQPGSFTFQVALLTAHTVIAHDGQAAFDLLKDGAVPPGGALAIVEAAMDMGFLPPLDFCSHTFNVWQRAALMPKFKLPSAAKRGVIILCEAMVLHKNNSAEVLPLLTAADSPPPDHLTLHSDESLQAWDVRLRAWALRFQLAGEKLVADDPMLLPVRLRLQPPADDHRARYRRDEEVKDFQKFLGHVVPSYILRAKLVAGAISAPGAMTELRSVTERSGHGDYSYSRYDFEWQQSKKLRTWTLVDLATRLAPHDREALELVIKTQLKRASDDLLLKVAERAALFPNLRDLAIGLLNGVDNDIVSNPRPASEQVDLYVRCSRIAGLFDRQLGQYYFERAVTGATAIDEEATSLLESLCSLAERADEESARRDDCAAGEAFARVTESIYWRLGDSDHFPWSKCIRAITSLSPSIAAFTIGRWDQRGIVLLLDHLHTWLAETLRGGASSPEAAVAFGTLSPLGNDHAMRTALTGVKMLAANSSAMHAAMGILADHCQRLAPVSERKELIEIVTNWEEQNKLSVLPTDIKEFLKGRGRAEKFDRSAPTVYEPRTTSVASPTVTEAVDWGAVLSGAKSDDPAALTALLRMVNPKPESREPWHRRDRHTPELLERLVSLTEPSRYVRSLDALLNVAPDEVDFQDLVKAIKDRLAKWGHHALVREWRTKLSMLIARRRFSDFTSGPYFSFYRLDEVQEALGIDQVTMAQALAEELPDHLRTLHAQAVYGLIQLLAKTLPISLAREVLRDQLNELRKKLDREGMSVDGLLDCAPIAAGTKLEAAFLWFLFGHPDKRIRWRAVHSVRRLVTMGRTEILLHLRDLVSDSKKSPFLAHGTVFYWLAAKHSFLVLLDRLSAEHPDSVMSLSDFLSSETLAPSPPHALITMFAKRAALRLAKTKRPPFSRATIRRLEKAAQPRIGKARAHNNSTRHEDYRQVRTERFRFDSMDTLPYWYSPAGEVFGIGAESFCTMAEKWICDEWGVHGRSLDNDPVRKWQTRDRDWHLRSKRHGDAPVIEDLDTYLEFNAMFCVAGELASVSTALPSCYSDTRDPWGHWLSRWDNAWQDEWLYDRRQRTPLERSLWFLGNGSDDDAKELPSDSQCDQAIGFSDPRYPGYLLVYGDEHRHDYRATLHLRVDSALVSVDTAEAFLHAIANCSDRHDYRIPDEGDELQFDEAIGQTPFILKGWIAAPYRDREGADRFDPLRYQLEKITVMPGKSFRQFSRLTFDSQRVATYVARDKNPVSILQHWNDCGANDRHRDFETEGKRLWVRRRELLQFLKHEGCALILACEMTRRRDSDTQISEDQNAEKTRLYVIHPSGTVEAAEGRHRPRKPDR